MIWTYNSMYKTFGILVTMTSPVYAIFKPMYGRDHSGTQYITNSNYLTDIFIWEE